MRYTLLSLILVAAAGHSGAVTSTQDAEWESLSGDQSCIRTFRASVVENDADWEKLWAEHNCGLSEMPPLPEVDFDADRVIAVFLGSRERGGYSVKMGLEPNAADPTELLVSIDEEKPALGGFQITLLTQPYEFRKVRNAYTAIRLPALKTSISANRQGLTSANMPGEKMSSSAGLALFKDWESVAGLTGLRDALAMTSLYDGRISGMGTVKPGILLTQSLPPPAGSGRGRDLPPPAGQRGKDLPPPAGEGRGKDLPPPAGGGGRLPPPAGRRLPQPIYRGGPLPSDHSALRNATPAVFTFGMRYIGYWNGDVYNKTATGTLNRKGDTAGSRYSVGLTSLRVSETINFYYSSEDDEIYYQTIEETIGRSTRNLVILFTNNGAKPLMPWENERFTFNLRGSNISMGSQNGAYRYHVTFTVDPSNPGTVTANLTAGTKRKIAPDRNGVTAQIQASGGGLKLVIRDTWASEYAGETLDISFVIRRDDGRFFRRDDIVQRMTARNPLHINATGVHEHHISGGYAARSGKFYLESWSFRRANSAISTSGWIGKGSGNTINK